MDVPPSIHPTDQILHAYGLGKLDDASAGGVDKHLEQCPDCRRRVAEMSSDGFLGRFRDGHSTAVSRSGLESPAPAQSLDSSAAPFPVGWSISSAIGSWGAMRCSRSWGDTWWSVPR
jgi:anti-sigma factor RsiW